MSIIVCPLSEVARELTSSRPARLVSLLAPDQDAPEAGPVVRPAGREWDSPGDRA